VSNAYAVAMPAERRTAATSLRASTMQFGYLIGASAAGAALALGGYAAVGAVMASLFLGAGLLLLPLRAPAPLGRPRALFALHRTHG
jgi:predicted MFS family arabinose efflux permease